MLTAIAGIVFLGWIALTLVVSYVIMAFILTKATRQIIKKRGI